MSGPAVTLIGNPVSPYVETVMPAAGFLFGEAAGLADFSLAPV